jgi:hypothetical protein
MMQSLSLSKTSINENQAPFKGENKQVLRVLEALKLASHELQTHPTPNSADSNSSAIKALLELETESDAIFSSDPHLSTLSHHLTSLKTLINSLQNSTRRHGLRSFLTRRVNSHEISRVAVSIESEIQSWIDREVIETLIRSRSGFDSIEEEELLIDSIKQIQTRLSQGFNFELQELILKSRLYSELERILCNPRFSEKIREESASAIAELIHFNKDVFVGEVLMGKSIRAIISMHTTCSMKILCSLIKSIKSPLVDDIESHKEIPKIINMLNSEDASLQAMSMDCILEIAYYGRKESIEAMLNSGLIKKLVELQRSEKGGNLIDIERFKEEEEIKFLKSHPFASCVARFAVQLEVGEGLRQREKRAIKQEILNRVRESCNSDAECATIFAEVLWGASP